MMTIQHLQRCDGTPWTTKKGPEEKLRSFKIPAPNVRRDRRELGYDNLLHSSMVTIVAIVDCGEVKS